MDTTRKSVGGSVPWWKPPGLMDLSDADVMNASTSFSTGLRSGRDGGGGGGMRATTKLVERALAYVTSPNADHLAALYQLTRRANLQSMLFSNQHTTLCLRLLDVLAEHTLSITKSSSTTTSGTASDTAAMATGTGKTALTSLKSAELQQLLDLIYLFAKKTEISYPSHALGRLLQWLVASVISSTLNGSPCENETILKLQLICIAEMLKINAGMRMYIKEMKKIKEFYRALTILLNSTEDAEFLVQSMVILARLVLAESLGAKIFSPKNVDQALELLFSVLEGTWESGDAANGGSSPHISQLSDLLRHTAVLQCTSVDLLCNLADRSEILASLEKNHKMEETMESMVGQIHLNGNVQQMQGAIHFLSSTVSLGHHFRKIVIKLLSDHDSFHRVLQVVVHPSKMLGLLTAQLLLKVLGDDLRPFREKGFESSLDPDQLRPIINGLFRVINEASAVVQQCDTVDELASSEEYVLSERVCQLLTKLAAFPLIRSLCVNAINLNQSASVIQVESAQLASMDPQQLLQFQPRLSINLVMLLSSLVHEPSMEETHKRTLNQFLQSSDVATILGAALFNHDDKELVVETLLLFQQLISPSSNKRFHALSLAEGICHVSQRHADATDSLHSTISIHEANVEAHTRTIGRLQSELEQSLRLQDEVKLRHDQEMQEIKSKYTDHLRQKDELLTKTRDLYETKLRELNVQCETLTQSMNKKMGVFHHKEHLLAETRAKRKILEEENSELKRKVHVLEVRLDEIAQAHSVTMEETKLREKEIKSLQEEMVGLSSEYAGQREALVHAQDNIKKMEDELADRSQTQEDTFKELVLLSKAHKALNDDKDELAKEMDGMRDELSNLESLNISIQARLQEKKEMLEQVERKTRRLEETASIGQSALEDEREKRRLASRDLDELRKSHRKLESEAAMAELRAAEIQLFTESKDEHIRKCEEEIRHLSNDLKKHSKLQSLIHQLSSGGDPQAVAASAFLARDS